MYKSGYDPQAFTAFFEKIQAQEKKKPGTLAKAFDTHPQTPDRVEKSQEEIEKLLPPTADLQGRHFGIRGSEVASGQDREPAQAG